MLNTLEQAALLKKAGFVNTLLEARELIEEGCVEVHYSPQVFPEIEDQRKKDLDPEGEYYLYGYIVYYFTEYVPLGGQIFGVTEEHGVDEGCGDEYIKYHIHPSAGSKEKDLKKISIAELIKWAQQVKEAAPEAVELLREEIKNFKKEE